MRRLFLCLTLLAAGQSKPNFSGNWALNLEASDFSDPRAVKPDKLTFAIQQKGEHFKYKVDTQTPRGKRAYDVDVSVGGSPYESDAAGIVSMEWKGETLIVSTLFNPGQERQSDQVETWTLSADGKRFTDDLVVHPPQNAKNREPVHIVRVLEKQ